MIVALQPVPLAVRVRLSPQFRSYSRPSDLQTRFSHPERLYGTLRLSRPLDIQAFRRSDACGPPGLQTFQPSRLLTTFRINTCKSVSKQRTLTTFRINTYKKQGRGVPQLFRFELPPSYAPRGASIPCALTRLRILPVTTEVYPLRSSESLRVCGKTQFRSSPWTFSAPPTTRYPLPTTHIRG